MRPYQPLALRARVCSFRSPPFTIRRAGQSPRNRRARTSRVSTRSQPSDELYRQGCGQKLAYFRDLLAELLSCPHDGLSKLLQDRDVCVSLDFLNWLAEHELEVEADDKAEIAALGGKLLAIREGLDPVPIEDVEKEMRRQLLEKEALNEALVPSQRKASLLPLTRAGFAFIQKQVQKLEVDNKEARGRSTTEVIGRKEANGTAVPSNLDAADRILDVLLSISDPHEMKTALIDAFTPDDPPPAPLNLNFTGTHLLEDIQSGTPPSQIDVDDILKKMRMEQDGGGGTHHGASGQEGGEIEQLSTTPLQLLMAVDARVKTSASTPGDQLERLRSEILVHLKESTKVD